MATSLQADAETLRRHRMWFMIQGGLMIVLGALAVIMPGLATLATEILIGWLLLISGIAGIVSAFSTGPSAPGFWWGLIFSVLSVLAGVLLLWYPLTGVLTLTLVLASYFLAGGIAKIVMGLEFRRRLPRAWPMVMLSGAVDIVLGVLIMSGWPGTAVWAIGLLVGINLIMSGAALLTAAVSTRAAPA